MHFKDETHTEGQDDKRKIEKLEMDRLVQCFLGLFFFKIEPLADI